MKNLLVEDVGAMVAENPVVTKDPLLVENADVEDALANCNT